MPEDGLLDLWPPVLISRDGAEVLRGNSGHSCTRNALVSLLKYVLALSRTVMVTYAH